MKKNLPDDIPEVTTPCRDLPACSDEGRCALADRLTELLDDGTGRVSYEMRRLPWAGGVTGVFWLPVVLVAVALPPTWEPPRTPGPAPWVLAGVLGVDCGVDGGL